MSRLFPDRLVMELSPSAVRTARFSGFPGKGLIEEKTIPCDPAFGAQAWQGAVAALRTFQETDPCRAEVILSNHFVRYAVIPWSRALSGSKEQEAYIRHHFAKIHGERAKNWAVRASPAPAGAARLASAIDPALLEELKAVFPKGGPAKLVSVQPLLMSRFNGLPEGVPANGAWLVIAEGERACVALHNGHGWRSVQNARGPWLALLERERFRAPAGEVPNLVLLGGAPTPADRGTWQFREFSA